MALGLASPLPCPPTARRSRCKGARNAREPATHPCMGLPLSRAFAERPQSVCVGSHLLPVSVSFWCSCLEHLSGPPRAARRKGAWAHRAARERSDELFRRPVRGGSDGRYSRSCPNLTSFASSLRLMFNPRGTRRSAQTTSAPQPCIRLDLADPGHEAVIRFSDRVPRRRAHSWRRREGRGASRVAATSDCSRRRSPNCRSTPKLEGVHMVMTLVTLLGEALRLAEPRPYEQDAIGR